MSPDDAQPPASASLDAKKAQQTAQRRSWFEIPPGLKRIFDRFPLRTYAGNELPLRAPQRRGDEHVLHVFTTRADADAGRPSFNPACLKWQTCLKLSRIPHRTVVSTNHASPSGALPFLLPAGRDDTVAPVVSSKLTRWIAAQQRDEEVASIAKPDDVRFEAYQTLLDSRIRVAWLYQLYLQPANTALLHRLYIAPCSSNPIVQLTIAHQLRQAAETEIVKANASGIINGAEIFRAADEAWAALASLLDENAWFGGQEQPRLLDASAFAYTHLLLDPGMVWGENQLGATLEQYRNLVQHQKRLADMCY